MIEMILRNKEWIFSGIGVAIISWLFFRGSNKSLKMSQKSGNNSTNIQVGGDVKDSFRGDKNGN